MEDQDGIDFRFGVDKPELGIDESASFVLQFDLVDKQGRVRVADLVGLSSLKRRLAIKHGSKTMLCLSGRARGNKPLHSATQ